MRVGGHFDCMKMLRKCFFEFPLINNESDCPEAHALQEQN